MLALCAITYSGMISPVYAEHADKLQPTFVEADHQTYDDIKQVSVFTGNVIVNKGTMHLTGDRAEVREDELGYQYATVDASDKQLASFRQRKDVTHPGIEQYINGHAKHIAFDGKLDIVTLTDFATVILEENGRRKDEMNGAKIIYDNRNARYEVLNDGTQHQSGAPHNNASSTSSKSSEESHRIRIMLAPGADNSASQPNLPAKTKHPSSTLHLDNEISNPE